MKELFSSRKFWATLITLLVILIATLSPGFDLDADQAAGFTIIIVSYIIGVAVDPGPGGWRGVVQSRKFWAAAIGLVVMFLNAFQIGIPFGLTPEILISFAVTIGAYIAGVAIEGPPVMDEHDIQSFG